MRLQTLAIILAGGKGSRLEPLTTHRAKPAVPFAGGYRIIDFPLSNCINSGLFQVLVFTQYKSLSLDQHLDLAWKPLFQRELGANLDVIPPQQRITNDWYRGTADAVYQNIYSIKYADPDDVLILAGDHIYAMDYREMLQFHREHQADVTIGTLRVPVAEAALQFGIVQVDPSLRVVGFQEKPAEPVPIPEDPGHTLASMGIYVFKTRFLLDALCANASEAEERHDFGHNVLPAILPASRMVAFPFRSPDGKAHPYWKDVGTLDAFFDANQELLSDNAPAYFRDEGWPIRTFRPNLPPPVILSDSKNRISGSVHDSIICAGSKLLGADVSRSILGYKSCISPGARLDETILLGDVAIGRNVQLRRTIVDKHARIPDFSRIGFDQDADLARGFTISPRGVTVVPKGFTS